MSLEAPSQQGVAKVEPLSPDHPDVGAHPAACPVVGVGASAGGLEAFQAFLGAAPPDARLAYVLVQHLDPNHESMLAELLSRRTRMPVQQIVDGMEIRPQHVYLIPPNASLSIERATLRLSKFSEPRGFRRPIDDFFRSLAVDQGPNAACVVLSGTGGDGSEGLRAVKEAGGLTVVQDVETAKYDGMPKAAIATGLVDKMLAPSDMPDAIRDYFERGQPGIISVPETADFLLAVCHEVRKRLGHDFSQYKRSTMLRRIQRRMQVVGAANGADYLDRLKQKPDEAELLFRDLLINVTCFFRDAEAFDVIRREIVPELLRGKGAADTVRIWSPGCSSGEEAYSMAILLAEALSRTTHGRPTVQIFATDIDEQMLQRGRSASYPHTAVRDVPLELLDRYFFAQDDCFVLTQQIRDMVRFSNHNLIKDPPFSRVDLIVCRNLLIYLNPSLQQRLIPVFHYALKPRGWLFLGSAENIAARGDLFDTVDGPGKIYRRIGGHRQSVAMPLSVDPSPLAMSQPSARGTHNELADSISRRMLERYAPPYVVVNAQNTVIRASGRTSRFFELAEGAPSNNVADLAKRGLRATIRNLLDAARQRGRRIVKRGVNVESDDGHRIVDVSADPLNQDEMLLVFQETGSVEHDVADDGDATVLADLDSHEDRVRRLEEELDENRSRLRTTVEELETSNEELKSSNEEMMSMNEELQSTNEELATVNEELKTKVEQLARANSDMQNFIESTQVPTIFLDRDLRIRSFTPATTALFRLQAQDHGRALADVVSRVDHDLLKQMSLAVLEQGQPSEEEVAIDDGAESFMLRVLPYVDMNDVVDGVVIVFTDVTKVRQTQADLARNVGLAQRRSHEIETLYRTAPVGIALIDRNLRFLKANQRFADLWGHTTEAMVGETFDAMAADLAPKVAPAVMEVFETSKEIVNFQASVRLNGDGVSDLLIDFYPYKEDDRIVAVGVILKDVTEFRRLEKELRRLMDELQHRVKNTLATVLSIVNQSVAAGENRADLLDTIRKRIGALANTHSLLTQQDWRSASLHDIVRAELSPYGGEDRITIDGPSVLLPPKHALTLTLSLHELATNAAKYGVLAQPDGRLVVEWTVRVDRSGQRLTLRWEEDGVPDVKTDAKPGFGSRLIQSAVVHDLQGDCDYALRPGGVICVLSFPF